MNRKIKLIWDFKGLDAQKTAEHHQIHLKEFDKKENINSLGYNVESINEMHYTASMIVKEEIVLKVRDVLIPNRAEIVD